MTGSAFGELDVWLARAGRHEQLWEKLGAHLVDGGVRFAVWAPNAHAVSVIGDFNGWDPSVDLLAPVAETGIWEGVVDGAAPGERYKYLVDGVEKADPLAFCAEPPPKTASVVFESSFEWSDADWISARREQEVLDRPLSIYEVHAPSWRRGLGWRELADQLAPYVQDLGFTHVELLPVMHHPFSGSWGYQVTGYYATLSSMGSPDDFRYFVDRLHRGGIGVILDWVPAHFPRDEWALVRFDGTALYEHDDPRRGAHPDWGTLVFNLGRTEVQNFLLADALFWLREYHADGLRVDAVASMLYLDYSRREGEWVPNRFGGREDLEAVAFLKELNELVHAREPGVLSIAEESTAWPGV
jgi:1,4-alpha-glucan branching enzyme